MTLLHPERVAAACLRSGVPMLESNPDRPTIKAYALAEAVAGVPIMCNLGTKEGVTVKEGRFAGAWASNEKFFTAVRAKGGLIGVSVDPFTSHECGNQRYFTILWLDECLTARLPEKSGGALKPMPTKNAWLAPLLGAEASAAGKFTGEKEKAVWLPNEAIAKAWSIYVKDAAIPDTTPPPAPTKLVVKGNELSWEAEADMESGLAHFIIERDGKEIGTVPEQPKNPFGRPVFQGLQYSDTPTNPLVEMRFTDKQAEAGKRHEYRVIAVNTAGLKSE